MFLHSFHTEKDYRKSRIPHNCKTFHKDEYPLGIPIGPNPTIKTFASTIHDLLPIIQKALRRNLLVLFKHLFLTLQEVKCRLATIG